MGSGFRWIGKADDGNTITLKKFDEDFKIASYATEEWLEKNADIVKIGMVLDTETTGINKQNDTIIEIGIRCFQFNKNTGEIVKIVDSLDEFQDPGRTLSPEIVQLTGLTNEFLAGKKIDWDQVDLFLKRADIIIAHNASFDRPFVEKFSKVAAMKAWACTAKQIDWYANGFSSGKLELLSVWHGFFTDAHRALSDADALLHLLTFTSSTTEKPYMLELLTNARRAMVKICATNSPFESKDQLRERSYYWDSEKRVWQKVIYKDQLETEIAWMQERVYNGGIFRGTCIDIAFTDNFKSS